MTIKVIFCLVVSLASGLANANPQISQDAANKYCEGVALGHISLLVAYLEQWKHPSDNQLVRNKAISDALKLQNLADETRYGATQHVNGFTDEHFRELTDYFKRSGQSNTVMLSHIKSNSKTLMPQKFEDCRKELRAANSIK